MTQLLKLFFSLCLLTSGLAYQAMAGGSIEHFFSDEELLLHYGAVAVAEIIAIVDPDADTNKNPPKTIIFTGFGDFVGFLWFCTNTTRK